MGRAGSPDRTIPDRGLLPLGQPQQALDPARPAHPRRRARPAPAPGRGRRARRELPGRRPRPPGIRRCDARRAEPGPRPPRHQRLRAERPWADRPGLRLRPAGEAGLMSITGFADADGGHPTQGRRRDRDVSRGCSARWASWRRSWPAIGSWRPPARPAGRRVDPRIGPGRPGEPGPERVRDGRGPGPARQRPPEHRPVRDIRHGRWRDRGRRRLRAPVGAVLRRGGCARPGDRPALRHERRSRREPGSAAAATGSAVRAPRPSRTGCAPSPRPRSRAARSTTSSRRSGCRNRARGPWP